MKNGEEAVMRKAVTPEISTWAVKMTFLLCMQKIPGKRERA